MILLAGMLGTVGCSATPEQRQAQAYERFLKQSIGELQKTDRQPRLAHVAPADSARAVD